jgi:hypothetical protein
VRVTPDISGAGVGGVKPHPWAPVAIPTVIPQFIKKNIKKKLKYIEIIKAKKTTLLLIICYNIKIVSNATKIKFN